MAPIEEKVIDQEDRYDDEKTLAEIRRLWRVIRNDELDEQCSYTEDQAKAYPRGWSILHWLRDDINGDDRRFIPI